MGESETETPLSESFKTRHFIGKCTYMQSFHLIYKVKRTPEYALRHTDEGFTESEGEEDVGTYASIAEA